MADLRGEQVKALNQIIGAIDEKASRLKEQRFEIKAAQFQAERSLLYRLIDDALKLAGEILPRPVDVIDDLKRLRSQFERMN